MSRAHLLKQAANAAYAARFPRRNRRKRRKARRVRIEARELAWLAAMEIARDRAVPLTR